MSGVLFLSQNPLERAENMRAVYEAFDGPKEFRTGYENMVWAEYEGFDVVVCDTLPWYMEGKSHCKVVNICHAITGNKFYGMDEDGFWVNPDAFAQTDIAIAASVDSIPIVARQLNIPTDRVVATGLPRTDAYIGKQKGDGKTPLSWKRAYLYVPTYRDPEKGGWMPRIDWDKVDGLLEDGEIFVVKRHYFDADPLVGGAHVHVAELPPMEPVGRYLIDCDVLLTDYSSIEFDGYLLGKPAILTVDDKDEYLRDRGMYFEYPDFYSSRSIHAEGHEEELVDMMREAAANGLNDTERNCVRTLAGMCDGHATERVCEIVKSLI